MRKDIYVVGWSGAKNVVYGKYHVTDSKPCNEDYAQPMTEFQAKRALKKNPEMTAFKLVPV